MYQLVVQPASAVCLHDAPQAAVIHGVLSGGRSVCWQGCVLLAVMGFLAVLMARFHIRFTASHGHKCGCQVCRTAWGILQTFGEPGHTHASTYGLGITLLQ